MNIAGTELNLKYRALEIYIAGCKGYCEGCQNPELWNFDIPSINPENIYKELRELQEANLVNAVWVLGGEPLDQKYSDLIAFVKNLQAPIRMLWTHFSYIPPEILQYFTHVKTGPYIKGKESYIEPLFGITLANPEQRIYKC